MSACVNFQHLPYFVPYPMPGNRDVQNSKYSLPGGASIHVSAVIASRSLKRFLKIFFSLYNFVKIQTLL